MHDYLRAIGFRAITAKEDIETILWHVANTPTAVYSPRPGMESAYGTVAKDYADHLGLLLRGEFNDDNEMAKTDVEYYLPYLHGRHHTTTEDVSIEKHADKRSYVGVCDEVNVGVSLIFQLINMNDYELSFMYGKDTSAVLPITLSALSIEGRIILPILKNEQQKERTQTQNSRRNQMIAAARQGDQDAMESLTLEDIDLYTAISRRARTEDILSIVETYFMPYGISCDQYSVLGNILDVEALKNEMTKEEVYRLTLECNDLVFDVCINEADLMGEPEIGRRFRGNIWLQGIVDFG